MVHGGWVRAFLVLLFQKIRVETLLLLLDQALFQCQPVLVESFAYSLGHFLVYNSLGTLVVLLFSKNHLSL